jgi:hypothetical protein
MKRVHKKLHNSGPIITIYHHINWKLKVFHFCVIRGFLQHNGQEHLIGRTEKKDENVITCLFLSAFFEQNKEAVDVKKSVTLKMLIRNVSSKI